MKGEVITYVLLVRDGSSRNFLMQSSVVTLIFKLSLISV